MAVRSLWGWLAQTGSSDNLLWSGRPHVTSQAQDCYMLNSTSEILLWLQQLQCHPCTDNNRISVQNRTKSFGRARDVLMSGLFWQHISSKAGTRYLHKARLADHSFLKSSCLCYHMLMAVYIFTNTGMSVLLTVVSCREGRRVSYGLCWARGIMINQLPMYLDPNLLTCIFTTKNICFKQKLTKFWMNMK